VPQEAAHAQQTQESQYAEHFQIRDVHLEYIRQQPGLNYHQQDKRAIKQIPVPHIWVAEEVSLAAISKESESYLYSEKAAEDAIYEFKNAFGYIRIRPVQVEVDTQPGNINYYDEHSAILKEGTLHNETQARPVHPFNLSEICKTPAGRQPGTGR